MKRTTTLYTVHSGHFTLNCFCEVYYSVRMQAAVKTVMVTGANRGLGLEFVKQFVGSKSAPNVIIAACRKPDTADELQSLSQKNSNLKIVQLDVADINSIDNCFVETSNLLGDNGLGLLINNAGINHVTPLRTVTMETMIDSFRTNACGPLFVTKALVPQLKKAANIYKKLNKTQIGALVVNVTGILGSISMSNGGFYSYRTSKAAANMVTKTLSAELKSYGILTVAVHPGWVKTDMGGPKAQLTTEESVCKMMDMFKNLKIDQAGYMLENDGKKMEF